jgi:hypothetical protein
LVDFFFYTPTARDRKQKGSSVQHVYEIEEKPLEKLRQIEHGGRERE